MREEDSDLRELLVESRCYSPEAIRAFLRYSRKHSDDNLHNNLPRTGSCAGHISTSLFPEWSKRDRVLNFCESVANRKTKEVQTESHESTNNNSTIDPRIDAYGARDSTLRVSPREEQVLQWVQTERNIEGIVRDTSSHLLADKCGSFSASPQQYLDLYNKGEFVNNN